MAHARKQLIAGSWAYSIALLILVGMLVAAAWHMAQVARLDAQRGDAATRVLALLAIHRELLEAETTQRGYLLTGDPARLAEFDSTRLEVLRLAGGLEENDSQYAAAAEITRLQRFAEQRLVALQDVITTHDTQGHDAAHEAVRSRVGATEMERFALLNQAVVDAEMTHLDAIRARTARSNHTLNFLLAAGSGLILLMAAIALAGKQRDLKQQRSLSEQLKLGSVRISQLNELNNDLLSCKDHDESHRVIAHGLQHLFPGTAGGVYTYRSSRDVLELRSTWGEVLGEPRQTILAEECWGLRRGRTHKFHKSSDLACEHWQDTASFKSVCVPMMALGETVGLAFIQSRDAATDEDLFAPENLELVDTVASQVASAVANLKLQAALQQQSVKDPLTGLFNRRYLEETLQRETIRATRNGTPLTIIMTDIDRFKSFNDVHGHQAGDQVLQRFAAELSNRVRGDDLACRYGGEEFTLVLPGADTEMAMERAEALRAAVRQVSVKFEGDTLPEITASFGVASYPAHGDDYQAVIQRADRALYRAKHTGRDRVVAADDTFA